MGGRGKTGTGNSRMVDWFTNEFGQTIKRPVSAIQSEIDKETERLESYFRDSADKDTTIDPDYVREMENYIDERLKVLGKEPRYESARKRRVSTISARRNR